MNMTDSQKLDELIASVANLDKTLVRMEQIQITQAEKVHEHSDTLYGNGRPGLKERVDTAEIHIKTQVGFCAAMQAKKPPRWVQAVWGTFEKVAAAMVVGVIAWIFWIAVAQQVLMRSMSAGAKP